MDSGRLRTCRHANKGQYRRGWWLRMARMMFGPKKVAGCHGQLGSHFSCPRRTRGHRILGTRADFAIHSTPPLILHDAHRSLLSPYEYTTRAGEPIESTVLTRPVHFGVFRKTPINYVQGRKRFSNRKFLPAVLAKSANFFCPCRTIRERVLAYLLQDVCSRRSLNDGLKSMTQSLSFSSSRAIVKRKSTPSLL